MTSTIAMPIMPPPVLVLLGRAAIDPPPCLRPIGTLRARLGFPSPAEDFEDDSLDLNTLLIRNPPATFFYRAEGRSMEAFGIFSGDILAVDRSLEPCDGDLVLATWDGNGPVCKLLERRGGRVVLLSGDGSRPIEIPAGMVVEAFVVTSVVRQVARGRYRHVRPR